MKRFMAFLEVALLATAIYFAGILTATQASVTPFVAKMGLISAIAVAIVLAVGYAIGVASKPKRKRVQKRQHMRPLEEFVDVQS